MKTKIKYYGFTPLTGKKVFGYDFKFLKTNLFIKSYDDWHSVTKIFVKNGDEKDGDIGTTD